jgi:hypothetical protein
VTYHRRMRLLFIVPCLLVASLAHAKPETDLRKLADTKIKVIRGLSEADWEADDSEGLFSLGYRDDGPTDENNLGLGGPEIKTYSINNFSARVSPDGNVAVVSYIIKTHYLVTMDDGGMYDDTLNRVTEIAKKTKDGWRVTFGLWTDAVKNDEANKTAKAGKLPALKPLSGKGDASLIEAFTKLTTGSFDEAATKRKDLIAIGSGPNERTTSGAILAKAWQAAWSNKVKVDSVMASNDANATLGYVMANVTLQKSGFTIPFRVLVVFERKTSSDPWSVVHMHFAVPPPP